MIHVTRTYLGMESRDQLKAAPAPAGALSLTLEHPCDTALYRVLYDLVGRGYHWVDRHRWSDAQLRQYLDAPGIAIWVLRDGNALGGFFELVRHADGSTEIAYFGLAPTMIGRGAGKWLLTRAIEEAWRLQPSRVWLHTCTLDHPSALPNYIARGFEPYRTESYDTAD
ncbi:MAG: GNAT family N-acetyltransferase [Gemmatimonadaceae bacterium]